MKTPWTYVGGTFDLFHAGHVAFLKAVAEKAHGPIVVALNTDEFATRYKRKPIMRLDERYAVVEACRHVDRVVVNTGDEDSWKTIFELHATGTPIKYIAHGDDWVGPTLMRQMNLTHGGLAAHGMKLLHVPYTQGISSTEIEHRVNMRIMMAAGAKAKTDRSTGICCGDPGDCRCS